MPQCKFHKQDGVPCGARAMRGAAFCFSHNPNAAAKKREAVAKGGRNRRTPKKAPLPPKSVAVASVFDIEKMIFQTVADYRNGLIEESSAKTVAYLCGVAVKVAETVGLAERMAALTERVSEIQHRIARAV